MLLPLWLPLLSLPLWLPLLSLPLWLPLLSLPSSRVPAPACFLNRATLMLSDARTRAAAVA
jgi:hypothetical protein